MYQQEQEQQQVEQAELVEREPSNFILTKIEKIRFELLSIVLGDNNISEEEFILISRKYDKLKLRATT